MPVKLHMKINCKYNYKKIIFRYSSWSSWRSLISFLKSNQVVPDRIHIAYNLAVGHKQISLHEYRYKIKHVRMCPKHLGKNFYFQSGKENMNLFTTSRKFFLLLATTLKSRVRFSQSWLKTLCTRFQC